MSSAMTAALFASVQSPPDGTPCGARKVWAAPAKRSPLNASGPPVVTPVMLTSTCLVRATKVVVGGGVALVLLLLM